MGGLREVFSTVIPGPPKAEPGICFCSVRFAHDESLAMRIFWFRVKADSGLRPDEAGRPRNDEVDGVS
jgi:hypothetical protein